MSSDNLNQFAFAKVVWKNQDSTVDTGGCCRVVAYSKYYGDRGSFSTLRE